MGDSSCNYRYKVKLMSASLVMIFRVMIFLSIALLAIGIFKPDWLRFRQKQSGRIPIVAVAIGLLIIGFTGVGVIQYVGKNNAEAVNSGKMLGEAVYVVNNNTLRCDPGAKVGSAGSSNDEKTSVGIRYMVKTPVNYNASIAHPLLMVYSPGGKIDMSRRNICISRKRPRWQALLWPMPITAK